jgi:CubicO group peptidase (beta-lactamase class C family)
LSLPKLTVAVLIIPRNGSGRTDQLPSLAMTDPGELMTGFPPGGDRLVTLENWTSTPHLRWGFQHVRELVPTARIGRGDGDVHPLERDLRELGATPVRRPDGGAATVDDVVAESFTDGLIVLHRGRIVTERYENGMTPSTPHLLQSVSKSFAGVLTGIVAERGQLNVDGLVTDHVSDLAGSSFEGATVRDVLDMRTGTAYDETYTDRDADVCITEQLGAWRPARPGRTAVNLYEQIAQLENDGPHGVAFRYRSILTDLLGWILERSTGVRYADLLSRELWSKLGAEQDSEITIHRGVTMPSGGMSATLRDLARFGQMMLQGGQLGGRRIVPEAWALDSRTGDAASRAAFEQGELRKDMPGWLYRSKWWVQDAEQGIHMALGIHGQTIWLHPPADVVCVKLSTWPTALDDPVEALTRSAFEAIVERLRQRG